MGLVEVVERAGVREVLAKLEEEIAPSLFSGEPKLLHVELPTGYGKSMTSALIAQKIASGEGKLSEYAQRVIHVVPTRYLVEDLVNGSRNLIRDGSVTVRGQCMFFDPSLKDPYFLSDLVFTTFDSYTLNFFKIPVGEVELISSGLSHGHFDVPRYAILSAVNVFDEYHVFAPGDTEVMKATEYESKSWTALNAIIRHLTKSYVPVVLETATPRLDALPSLLNQVRVKPLRIALKLNRDTESHEAVAVYDDAFTNKLLEARYETKLENGSLADILKKYIKEIEKPLLVASNNVKTAVSVYSSLRENGDAETYLIHSLFTLRDRRRLLKRLHSYVKNKREFVVVATQVIEVGVNLDFASAITEVAPLCPLVQRVGRVNRSLEDRTSHVVIVYDNSHEYEKQGTYAGVYDLDQTKNTWDVLREANEKGEIGWRMTVIEESLHSNDETLVTVSAIARKVYGKEPPKINVDYQKILSGLLDIMMGSREALMILKHLGSFVRESIIVPVYVPSEKPEKGSLPIFKSELLIACPAFKLGLDLANGKLETEIANKVLEYRDDSFFAIVEKDGNYEIIKLKSKDLVEGIMRGFVRYEEKWVFLRALVARPDAYSRELGLKVW
jgi:CRISPR-associated helicase Cas3